MSESPVRVEVDGQILIVTLDRPKANAVDAPTSRAIYEAFVQLRDDPDLRVGILTGAGDRFFCAGWDLKAAAAGEAADADWGGGGFAGITEFWDLGKPVIAAVNGMAFGGGFELALAADIVIAADHAVFALTEARLGLAADAGGLFIVPAIVPKPIAVELLITGRRLSADEAARLGLVNHVVPAGELMAKAREIALRIIESAPLSVAAILEVLEATHGMNPQDGFARIRAGLPHYSKVASSEDAQEGARAFVEGRPPVWQGR
ncbi:MAG: enoyl-CoA hydratase-related protein [Actinomycetes bacterium]|jgi:crotonobetainyl-CoA hydratase